MRELEETTGQPARLIRYLISEGVVPPPEGATRSASYDERHIEALRHYANLKAKGISSLDIMRAAIARKEPEPGIVILNPAEGIELRIEPGAMERLDLDSVLETIRTKLAAHARNNGKGTKE